MKPARTFVAIEAEGGLVVKVEITANRDHPLVNMLLPVTQETAAAILSTLGQITEART